MLAQVGRRAHMELEPPLQAPPPQLMEQDEEGAAQEDMSDVTNVDGMAGAPAINPANRTGPLYTVPMVRELLAMPRGVPANVRRAGRPNVLQATELVQFANPALDAGQALHAFHVNSGAHVFSAMSHAAGDAPRLDDGPVLAVDERLPPEAHAALLIEQLGAPLSHEVTTATVRAYAEATAVQACKSCSVCGVRLHQRCERAEVVHALAPRRQPVHKAAAGDPCL